MSIRSDDLAGADEAVENIMQKPVSGVPDERTGTNPTFASSLLYGTLALALTCGPLLIPGIGLGAALMWIVGGGTAVFLGLLLWAIVRSIGGASGPDGRRRKR